MIAKRTNSIRGQCENKGTINNLIFFFLLRTILFECRIFETFYQIITGDGGCQWKDRLTDSGARVSTLIIIKHDDDLAL